MRVAILKMFQEGRRYEEAEQVFFRAVKRLWEFLLWLSGLRTQHSVPKDVGSIPGLTQWVRDLVLPHAAT